MGGCDKQGFPMKQGVLTSGRVRLLLHRGITLFPLYFLLLTFSLLDWNLTCISFASILQAHLASVVLAGVMVSAGGSPSVVALSAKTCLLSTWWLSRRVRMICQALPTLRSPGWGDPRGLPRSRSSSTLARMMMSAAMSTHTAGPSLTRRVSFQLCLLTALALFLFHPGSCCVILPSFTFLKENYHTAYLSRFVCLVYFFLT